VWGPASNPDGAGLVGGTCSKDSQGTPSKLGQPGMVLSLLWLVELGDWRRARIPRPGDKRTVPSKRPSVAVRPCQACLIDPDLQSNGPSVNSYRSAEAAGSRTGISSLH